MTSRERRSPSASPSRTSPSPRERIVRDDVEKIRAQVKPGSPTRDRRHHFDGRHGFTGRDVTPEAVEPLFEKEDGRLAMLF